MSPEDFSAELYRDFEWRSDELTALTNLITREKDGETQSQLRKAVVVVLYAHFEGFCIFGLNHYVTAVNREQVLCKDAVAAIVAGGWEPVFRAMETGDQKCRVFSRPLPSDDKLHRHWRRRHFVEELDGLKMRAVKIPDDVVDSESNLRPAVLQRNLFLLGLDHRFVDPHCDTINSLLARRNRIAHGDDRRGVSKEDLRKYEGMVFDVCFELVEFLDAAFRTKAFLMPI